MNKILIIDDVHPLLMEAMETAGFEVVYRPDCTKDEVLALAADCSVLVLRSKITVDEALLRALPKLRLIARAGAGTDNIHEASCNELGIGVVHASGANSDAVGEQTLGMLLSLMSRIAKGDREVRRGIWNREGNRGVELKGKTVGVIGCGYTGSAFVERLAPFGVQVLVFDPYKDALFQDADVLSLHVPLTHETRFMVNADFLSRFSKPIYLLNLSRGAVLRTKDAARALQQGQLRGLALDVLEQEPPEHMSSEDKLWFAKLLAMEEVLFTPHVGGWSTESYERISGVLAARIIRWFNREAKMPVSLLDYYKI
jgi:D-3-phosphoglycerate dehydrogenase